MGLLGAGNVEWRTIFYIGGAVPLAISLLLITNMPESPAFLVDHGAVTERVAAIVRRIAPELPEQSLRNFTTSGRRLVGVPVKYLFADGRAVGTLLLWVPFFCDFLILVSVNAWMPSLLRANGYSASRAGFAIALNSVGSTAGAILVGRIMDRYGAYSTLIGALLGATLCVGTLGYATNSFGMIAVFATLAGFFAGAAQAGVIALAALLYPVSVRSTGVGWAMAMGRFGAVVGPLMGGMFLTWNWPVAWTYLGFALPGLLGAAAVVAIQRRAPI